MSSIPVDKTTIADTHYLHKNFQYAILEAMLQEPKREAITMMFLVIANVPLLYFLNKDWFHTLIYTTPGKIALAVCAAIILFSLTQIMKLSRPIEYGGDGT